MFPISFVNYYSHPYNPLKSLAHPYQGSPTGSVTLTRSVVLVLSGDYMPSFSLNAKQILSLRLV